MGSCRKFLFSCMTKVAHKFKVDVDQVRLSGNIRACMAYVERGEDETV